MRQGGSERKGSSAYRRCISLVRRNSCFALSSPEDKPKAQRLLSSLSQQQLLRFCGLVRAESFAGLVMCSLHKLQLSQAASDVVLAGTQFQESGIWFGLSLTKNLERMSIGESDYFEKFGVSLAAVARKLVSDGVDVLWTKGNTLARTLYEEPEHRRSSDFDLLLRPRDAQHLHNSLVSFGYRPIRADAGFCHQLNVGPTDSFRLLFLAPSSEFVPSSVVGYDKDGWPIVDVKFNVLDKGLRSVETERVFDDAKTLKIAGSAMKYPSELDHLLISIIHAEKDRFVSWRSLVDIHLLCNYVSANGLWDELLRRARVEEVSLSVWAALTLVEDRFKTACRKACLGNLRLTPHLRVAC